MKKVKNGFTMIELLFVMSVMSILIAIAIPNLNLNNDTTRSIELKELAKKVVKYQQKIFVERLQFAEKDRTLVEGDNEKVYFNDPYGNKYIFLKKNIYITTNNVKCEDETTGLYLKLEDNNLTNPKYEKYVIYNSCTQDRIIRPEVSDS